MSKTLKHDLKVDALLDKGMELIWSKGYNATSVNDIVKAAEIPKGSFYFYFESKEDFVLKALDKYFKDQFLPALQVLQDKSFSAKKRLLNFYEFKMNFLKDELLCKKGCMCCNLASEMAEHNEKIRESIALKGSIIKEHIENTIREAQEGDELGKGIDARDLTEFLEDAGKGAMITMKEVKSSYPIDNLMTMIREVLLK